MTALLHAQYLRSDVEYEACIRFWRTMFEEAVESAGGSLGEWSSWIPRHYANGTPIDRDELPVLEARAQNLDRALRVWQWEAKPNQQSGAFSGWVVDYAADGYDETFPHYELVLNVRLDSVVAEFAKHLLIEWTREDLDIAAVRRMLLAHSVQE